jgi:hypothetical protein
MTAVEFAAMCEVAVRYGVRRVKMADFEIELYKPKWAYKEEAHTCREGTSCKEEVRDETVCPCPAEICDYDGAMSDAGFSTDLWLRAVAGRHQPTAIDTCTGNKIGGDEDDIKEQIRLDTAKVVELHRTIVKESAAVMAEVDDVLHECVIVDGTAVVQKKAEAEVREASKIKAAKVLKAVCNIVACGRPAKSRGLCALHYQQYARARTAGKEQEFLDSHRIVLTPARPATEVIPSSLPVGDGLVQVYPPATLLPAEVKAEKPPCLVAKCQYPALTRGLCGSHYKRYLFLKNSGQEQVFFDKFGVAALSSKKKETVPMRYNSVKTMRVTSDNWEKLTEWIRQFPAASIHPEAPALPGVEPIDTKDTWEWRHGFITLDRSHVHFCSQTLEWAQCVEERNLIMAVAEACNVRQIKIEGENVLISKFKYFYLLPDQNDPASFYVRPHESTTLFEAGTLLPVRKFSVMGRVLEGTLFWVDTPPANIMEYAEEDRRKITEACIRLISGEDQGKFDVVYRGAIPDGAYPGLVGVNESSNSATELPGNPA